MIAASRQVDQAVRKRRSPINSPSATPPGHAKTPLPTWVVNWFIMSNFDIRSKILMKPVRGSRWWATKIRPGVVFGLLPPWRPAFGGEIRAVVVGVGAAQDLRAVVGRRRGQPHVRVLGDDRVAVLVRARRDRADRIRAWLPIGAPLNICDGRSPAPGNRLGIRSQCSSAMRMRRDDEVAAALHPAGAFARRPRRTRHRSGSLVGGLLRAVLEAHQVARRVCAARTGEKPAWAQRIVAAP